MSKKSTDVNLKGILNNLEEETSEETINIRKSNAGRPATIKREITKSSQEGLKENWTRATFIVREDLLDKLKDYSYTDRRTLKEIVNEMIDDYLKDKEIIERSNK
ncbi:hypothetical protein DP144_13855 [Clostridium tetani]|uniref:hypothetical protein n=1 Tax=Clostridium tetani TaxID=1513 RepID=UPI00100ACB5E|nr:hypothetical protein [Clostridium tetani]RXM73648.1 hypothetical protein DP154_13945 [Clostridium tetani]RYU97813.1 hypothetical protein DP144_13855 [Clostridium tetani]